MVFGFIKYTDLEHTNTLGFALSDGSTWSVSRIHLDLCKIICRQESVDSPSFIQFVKKLQLCSRETLQEWM